MLGVVKFADWPDWVRALVLIPHGILGFLAAVLWWPKSLKDWRNLGIVAAYLLIFVLVMHYVFGA